MIYLKDNIEKEREREKERENERKRERAYIFYTRVYIFYTRLERERDFGSRQKVPSSFFLARTVGYQASFSRIPVLLKHAHPAAAPHL